MHAANSLVSNSSGNLGSPSSRQRSATGPQGRERRQLKRQLGMRENLCEVDEFAKDVDRLQFFRAFPTSQQLPPFAIERLDPLTTDPRFHDSQPVAVVEQGFYFVSNRSKSRMLDLDQIAIRIDRIDAKAIHGNLDGVRIGCEMMF